MAHNSVKSLKQWKILIQEKPKLKNKVNYHEGQVISKYLYKSASLLLLLLFLIIMKKYQIINLVVILYHLLKECLLLLMKIFTNY